MVRPGFSLGNGVEEGRGTFLQVTRANNHVAWLWFLSGVQRFAKHFLRLAEIVFDLINQDIKVVAECRAESNRFFAENPLVPLLLAGNETNDTRHGNESL
jgi:hypothetical protein